MTTTNLKFPNHIFTLKNNNITPWYIRYFILPFISETIGIHDCPETKTLTYNHSKYFRGKAYVTKEVLVTYTTVKSSPYIPDNMMYAIDTRYLEEDK